MEITALPEVECLHAGQKRAYGDSFYEYQVTTDEPMTREDLIFACNKHNPFGKEWKTKEEWQKKHASALDYFAGYCEILKNVKGYKVTFCLPYTD